MCEHSLPGLCQPHFTAAFMLLVLTATWFKCRLGLKSCLFAYLCLFILFVSAHYGEILLFIKPLRIPQRTYKHNAKWINWEVLLLDQSALHTTTSGLSSSRYFWWSCTGPASCCNSLLSGKAEGRNIWSVRQSIIIQ